MLNTERVNCNRRDLYQTSGIQVGQDQVR